MKKWLASQHFDDDELQNAVKDYLSAQVVGFFEEGNAMKNA